MRRSKEEARARAERSIRDLRDHVASLPNLKKTVIGRSTVPLFREKGTNRGLVQFGTAVLFALGKEVFLFTAAHVIESFGSKNAAVYVPLDGAFVEILGAGFGMPLPDSGNREDDLLDCGCVLLFRATADIFRHRAAGVKDMYLDPPPYHMHWLLIAGHPASSFRQKGRTVSSILHGVEAWGSPPNLYERVGVHPMMNILTNSGGSDFTENVVKRQMHSMRGMSGSGVWFVPEIAPAMQSAGTRIVSPKLLAIFTGERRKFNVRISGKLNLHLNLIEQNMPGFGKLIETEIQAHRASLKMEPWKK